MFKLLIKRSIALSLGLVLIFSISACAGNVNKPTENYTSDGKNTGNKLFNASTELSIAISSNSSWPYDEKWAVWKYIREVVGGKINLIVIPENEFSTKVALMMTSSNNLPDLMWSDKVAADDYSAQGALVSIDDYLDNMPNYTKFLNSIPEKQRNELLMQRRSADSKIYLVPNYGTEQRMNVRAWLYRKDVFDKNNLKTPETLDELYDVAMKLKKLYPDSYPICMRQGLRNINVIGPEWKPNFVYSVYYDFNNNKWCYGATEETMLDIIKYLQKLINAKLINPDFLTINSKTWEELISTNRGFIMPEYQTRLTFFNASARTNNLDFMLDDMMPPRANNVTGQNMIAKYNVDPAGYIICNTSNKTRINNAIKFIDWLYSVDGSQLTSWGKEGETYKVENGEKHFIKDNSESSPMVSNGFQTSGTYLRIDPKAAVDIESSSKTDKIDFVLKHTEQHFNPAAWLSLYEKENEIKKDIGTEIDTYVSEELSKFILGQEPMSKWDEFQKEIKDMGVDKLLGVYDSAYKRMTAEKK